MTPAQKEIDKRITRAIMEYGLLNAGDRVLLALSGGKDSLALAWNLAWKSKGFPTPFEVEAIHLVTGFTQAEQPDRLIGLLDSWGMKMTVLDHPAAQAAAEGRHPSCFSCARDRRRILLEYAVAHGFSKIALGHHMDDSLITLLMNMSWNGELAAMPPLLKGRSADCPMIIRPLILLQETVISRVAGELEWPVESCSCPWAGDSRRKEAASVLESLTGGSAKRKLNLWKSLSHQNPDLLPQAK